ncbi:MAG: FAD-dependent oxidoreductase [Lentisphaerae bacterium]|nr:FAD-dependent oxidoreductase [Lentisphaerota bacterium]
MNPKYDTIVFGGGTAGTIAAIQSARAGASTLLVEKNAMLGGTVTVGGINAPAHFFAWNTQIIRGIGWELVRKTFDAMGEPYPTPAPTKNNPKPGHIYFDSNLYAIICDEATLDAGVEILFHAMPATVKRIENNWHVQICTKSGIKSVQTTTLIDATGDANVVSIAGLELNRHKIVQPATLQMYCSGYDADNLDYAQLKLAADAAIARGELKSTDISWYNNGPKGLLKKHGDNSNHIPSPDAETSEGKTKIEIEGRRSVMRAYRFLRAQPGLKNFTIDQICSETAIRESVTIKGKKTVTAEDYEAAIHYDDALCYAFFMIDKHLDDGKGILQRPLQHKTIPTIPRGALLPKNSRFLIVAGRCLSSDQDALSALRVQCPCMAMGQAAGAMAAIAAKTGLEPEEQPIAMIHDLLREHGAIVPGDINPDSLE